MKNCASCGKENLDEAVFCAGCGSPLASQSVPEAPPVEEPAVEPTAETPVDSAPVGAPEAPAAPQADAYAYTEPAASAAPAQSNKAMLWLILNIVTTVLCCLTNIFSIIGIVFAAIGMSSYKKGDYEDMKKKAKISMILFIVGVAAGVLMLILSFAGLFAIPFLTAGSSFSSY